VSVPSLALRLRKCGNDNCRATHPSGWAPAQVRKIESRMNCLLAWKRRNNVPIFDSEMMRYNLEQSGVK
jgi:hypothetical protein